MRYCQRITYFVFVCVYCILVLVDCFTLPEAHILHMTIDQGSTTRLKYCYVSNLHFPFWPSLNLIWTLFDIVNICTEDYVKHCTPRRRSQMPQFRIGFLPLHIETGRFRDKRIDERVCLLCNSGEVDNELLYLCVCNTYSNYRQKFYSIVNNDNFLNMSNDEKFVFLLKYKWKSVCIYLDKAWDKRTEILFK